LYVGRLAIEKNIDAMLYAFQKVHTELSDAELIIVGTGPEEPRLRSMVADLNLSASVKFSGALRGKDLFDQYSNATCLVLPSKSEPWGLVVNESLHYGCPVIVSEYCGCVPELVVHGETGYVFNPDDSAELAKRMLDILDWSNSKSTALRCISLMEDYTPEHAAQSIYEGIKRLLKMGEPDKKHA
jgi:glycosyltransferase involved in cell wall biosynthesis